MRGALIATYQLATGARVAPRLGARESAAQSREGKGIVVGRKGEGKGAQSPPGRVCVCWKRR